MLLSSPLKAPMLPNAKKAFLVFAMFSATEHAADRFVCHHTPRHAAASKVATDCSPITIVSEGRGSLEILMSSSLEELSLKQLELANSLIMLDWSH